jgi:hypothetical protein
MIDSYLVVRNKTQKSCVHFTHLFPMVKLCKITIQYHNKDINSNTVKIPKHFHYHKDFSLVFIKPYILPTFLSQSPSLTTGSHKSVLHPCNFVISYSTKLLEIAFFCLDIILPRFIQVVTDTNTSLFFFAVS